MKRKTNHGVVRQRGPADVYVGPADVYVFFSNLDTEPYFHAHALYEKGKISFEYTPSAKDGDMLVAELAHELGYEIVGYRWHRRSDRNVWAWASKRRTRIYCAKKLLGRDLVTIVVRDLRISMTRRAAHNLLEQMADAYGWTLSG